MRADPRRVGTLVLVVGLLSLAAPAFAVITRLNPLREILAAEQLIFTVKVANLDRDKPAMMLQVTEDLKGQAPFRKLAINLVPDSEGQREEHTSKLLKRLGPDLTLIVFTSKRGKRYTAYAYTNGTWFQMIGQTADGPVAIRWNFTHCEPYLRRTFKGTTAELRQIVVDGLAGKKKPPEPDPKEPPGLGPELKPEHGGGAGVDGAARAWHKPGQAGSLFAVIPTFVIIGPLALLAALFPVLVGGLALVMRRWAVLLSIASLDSTLYLAHSWFHGYLKDSWLGSPPSLWGTLAVTTLVGFCCSWRRQKSTAGPSRSEHILLWTVSLFGLAVAASGIWQDSLLNASWRELLIVWSVPWVGIIYVTCLHFIGSAEQPMPARPSTESIMLGALTFACIALTATSLPRVKQADGVRLVWSFEPPERGAIISSPTLEEDRLLPEPGQRRRDLEVR
jgi:hypothetical protein